MSKKSDSSRRDFLTGKAVRQQAERAGDILADAIVADDEGAGMPSAGPTVRLATRAMACDFAVVMNPGPAKQVMTASDGLDMLHHYEDEMTVYRDDSALSEVNRLAHLQDVVVSPELFQVLQLAHDLALKTEGGFDPTSGPLIALWRECRDGGRIPTEEEIQACLGRMGIHYIELDAEQSAVRYSQSGVELNLGAIGKGYALDCVGEFITAEGLENWLIHGGQSSILARGNNGGHNGWPIGIRNPFDNKQRLATLLLENEAMSTSGSSIQFFRNEGKRYGHILDSRTGWPAEQVLSVTVVAPTAAEADALSTAFFVLGVEKTQEYCDNNPNVSALLIPPPTHGRKLRPVNCGISEESLFWNPHSVH